MKPDCKRRGAVPRWPCRFGISVVGVDNLVTDVIVDGTLVQARKAGTMADVTFPAVASVGTWWSMEMGRFEGLHKGEDVEKCTGQRSVLKSRT